MKIEKRAIESYAEANGTILEHYLMEEHPMNFINRIIEYDEQAFRAQFRVVMENLIIPKWGRELIHVAINWFFPLLIVSNYDKKCPGGEDTTATCNQERNVDE
jgi:hypothetical protein